MIDSLADLLHGLNDSDLIVYHHHRDHGRIVPVLT